MMGDFNARVGSANDNFEDIMGKHGVGTMNENGNLFVELCGNHSLKIGGTLFPHKECHKNTWYSNDHVTKAQLDHVCISSRWSKALLDVRVYRRADIGSDHHMLCASLRLGFARIYRKKTPSRRKFDTHKLRDGEIRGQFVERLKDDLGSTAPGSSVNENWNNIKRIFTNVSQEVLGYQENQRKDYISDETWKIIEERKETKMKRCAENDPQRIRELDRTYNELNKKVKRSVRSDWRKYLDGLAEEAQSAA